MKEGNEKGIIAGIMAYFLWGIFPLFWKMLDDVGSDEILAHRIVWCLVAMVLLLVFYNKTNPVSLVKDTLINKKVSLYLLLASSLVTANWYIYIWAVTNHHILDSSLGYYINPLFNVVLGSLFLKEKMNKGQWLAVLFAAFGVFILTIEYGDIPYIALSLALTFSLYGLVKKNLSLSANVSLFFETLFMTPFALGYLIYLSTSHTLSFGSGDYVQSGLLILGGAITALPLLLFGFAAQRVPFYMLGFMQYVSPTLQLVIGVFVFKESFSTVQLFSFSLIWIGLAIFTLSTTSLFRKKRKDVA